MTGDSLLTEGELVGDLPVRVAGGHQRDDLCLTLGQALGKCRPADGTDCLRVEIGPEFFEYLLSGVEFPLDCLVVSQLGVRLGQQDSRPSTVVGSLEIPPS